MVGGEPTGTGLSPIKWCPVCGHQMELTVEEGRSPAKQWQCLCGQLEPVYHQREDEQ